MTTRPNFADQADGEIEPQDAAECPACNGSGSVPVFVGPDRELERCQNCFGTGRELTRDEMLVICDGTCGDDQCEDCHPVCRKCDGKGFWGWGHHCEDCDGMGTMFWSKSDRENEHERRGMAAEQRAMEGPNYAERRAHELDEYRRNFR